MQQAKGGGLPAQPQERRDIVGLVQVNLEAGELEHGKTPVGAMCLGPMQVITVLSKPQGDGVRRRQSQPVGADPLAIGHEQHLDLRSVGRQGAQLGRPDPWNITRDSEPDRITAVPGGSESLLDRGALSLPDAIDEGLEAKLTALLEDRRVIGDYEPTELLQFRDRAENVRRHRGRQPGSLRLAQQRLQAMFCPLRRLHRNNDGGLHAAAGCARTFSAALATSQAVSASSSRVGRTAIR